jgi:hypothetical protein
VFCCSLLVSPTGFTERSGGHLRTLDLLWLLIALSALLDCWISRDEISRRGVMSRVCPDMEKSKFKEPVRIGGAGSPGATV